MKTIAVSLSILFCLVVTSRASNFTIDESALIAQVAAEYNLDQEQARLLTVIRKIENGRQGREFGVLAPEAMRFEHGSARDSFLTQARWAAGTIKKRYNGDLAAFAARWCPVGASNDPRGLNEHWLKNAQYWMNKMKESNHHES